MMISVARAAQIARCSDSHIHTLIRRGLILADRAHPGPRGMWLIDDAQDIAAIVRAHSPKAGYRKSTQGRRATAVIKRLTTAMAQPTTPTPSGRFDAFRSWAALDAQVRETLLALAARFTPSQLDELRTL